MAYYSGTAANYTALRTALLTHAQADGWVLTGDVLSKAGVFFRIAETATNVTCLGCESNAVANPAPNVVSIGRIFVRTSYTTREISFPCNYEVFGFAQELFMVVNYDTSAHQWMAFGKSTVPGLIGQGGWCAATIGVLGSTLANDPIWIDANVSGTNGSNEMTTAALAWYTLPGSTGQARNTWINHGIDGHGWLYNATAGDATIGIRWLIPLLGLQPSVWNSEAVLLPIRAFKPRPSSKSSLILDVTNARHIRVDNLAPGDILTLGADRWKVYPWYIKNSAVRDGGSLAGINHTGTFGWAIRYQGP